MCFRTVRSEERDREGTPPHTLTLIHLLLLEMEESDRVEECEDGVALLQMMLTGGKDRVAVIKKEQMVRGRGGTDGERQLRRVNK